MEKWELKRGLKNGYRRGVRVKTLVQSLLGSPVVQNIACARMEFKIEMVLL
jgi:hypothetical protein